MRSLSHAWAPADRFLMVAGAASLGFALYTLIGALRWPMVHDAPILNYIGWRISQGAVPYRDLFDMNMPGTYAVHTLLAFLPGSWDLRTAVAHVLVVSLAAGLCGLWAVRISGRVGAGMIAAASCIVLCLSLSSWNAFQRDLMLAVAAFAGLTVVSFGIKPSLRRLVIAGVLFGLASTIKPHALLIAGAYWGAVLLHAETRLAAKPQVIRRVLAMGLGVILAWVPLFGWLAVTGGLGEFVGMILPFNGNVYSQFNIAIILDSRESVFRMLVMPDVLKPTAERVLRLLIVAVATYHLVFERTGLARIVVSLAALASVALYYLQLKGWPYHLYPVYIFGSVLLADLLARSGKAGVSTFVRFALQATVAVALILTAQLAFRWTQASVPDPGAKDVRTSRIVEKLRPLVAGGKTVQVFDTAEGGADVLLRLQLKLPTSMLYDFPLFLDRLGPSFVREPAPRLQDRFLTELEHARPDYLLVYRVGWPRGGYDRLSWNERLNRFVSEQYEVADSEDDYRLMRRK